MGSTKTQRPTNAKAKSTKELVSSLALLLLKGPLTGPTDLLLLPIARIA